MDKILNTGRFAKLSLGLCLGAGVLFCHEMVNAASHSRDDARDAVISLRKSITNQRLPDELGSIETTFSVAEQYYRQNNYEVSEQYYLLTIQKARILKSVLSSTQKTELASITPAPPVIVSPKSIQNDNTSNSASDPKLNVSKDVLPDKAPKADATSQPTSSMVIDSDDDESSDEIASKSIVGNSDIYTVEKNDTLRLVAAKLGVTKRNLTELNHIDPKASLKIGQKLKYNNRKIIPQQLNNGIVINIPDRTLYYFKGGKLVRHMPVALGVAVKNKKYDWRTPTGKFKIISKKKDPTWYVPTSIQEEMEEGGKEVITSIPPGPNNPLGKYAFKTTLPGIMIHSTTKPWSIYSFASHGCIRVYPQQMEEFFKEIKVNTPGEIIYRPVKIVATEDGRVFFEVHQDVYGKNSELSKTARSLIEKHKLAERVDWDKVKQMIKQRSGVAEDISL